VHQLLHERVGTLRGELDGLIAKELAEFNKLLTEKNLAGVVAQLDCGTVIL
jgi:hypothetical protein